MLIRLKRHLKKLNKEEYHHPSKTNETEQSMIMSMGLPSMTPSEPEKDAISQSIRGHPKGTTAAYSFDLQEHLAIAKDEVAEAYCQEMSKAKCLRKPAWWGPLALIIERSKEKHILPAETKISVDTVRSWAKRGACKVAHKGHTSPMIAIEPYIVEIALHATHYSCARIAACQFINCWYFKSSKSECMEKEILHCLFKEWGERNDR